MKNFTFKKTPRATGLARITDRRSTEIKLAGKHVGNIMGPSMGFSSTETRWSISLVIKDDTQHCGWRNATLKARFDTEDEARAFLKEKCEVIQKTYGLHPLG